MVIEAVVVLGAIGLGGSTIICLLRGAKKAREIRREVLRLKVRRAKAEGWLNE